MGCFVEIIVTDVGENQVSEPIRRRIFPSDIQNAFTTVRLNVNQIPPENVLGQIAERNDEQDAKPNNRCHPRRR